MDQNLKTKKEDKMASKLLDNQIKEQVKEFFLELTNPVKMIFFGSEERNCDYCKDTLSLLEEIAELNEKISIEVVDLDQDKETASRYDIEEAPATVITTIKDGESIDFGVRFLGIPAGHEFTSLINGIVMVSKQDSGLSTETREQLAKLEHPVNLKVFVTPTCPYCPRAVIVAHQMAIESNLVNAEMVEAMEFPELSNKFNVSGVPHTVINMGAGEVVGAVPEANLMAEIEKSIVVVV
jgi:glutaredoxin-like protein